MVEDFMKPVIDIVDQLLAASVNVTVYNGQLDLIVDTMGKGILDWGWEQNTWRVEHEVANNTGTWISPVFCANLLCNWQHLNTTVMDEQLLVCFVYIPLRGNSFTSIILLGNGSATSIIACFSEARK